MLLGAQWLFSAQEPVKPALPYDAEVEYLQSTGTQYIDTGLKASNTTSVQTRVAWMELGYDSAAFHSDNGSTFNGGFGLQVTTNGQVFRFIRGNQYKDVGSQQLGFIPAIDTFYNISVGPDGIDVNGILAAITDTAMFTANGNLPLFAWRRGVNIAGYKKVKLGPTKIYDGATLFRDFIPVRFMNEQSVSEGAMYDRVSGQLFRNAGTGAFTIGPDKVDWTNPYVTDGLIAMWDGAWNVAGGQHDDSATTWVDISGNSRDAVLNGTYSWGANYWHVESVSGRGLATWPAQNLGNDQTIEFVIDASATSGYGRIIAEGQSVAAPIIRSNGVYMFGYGVDRGVTISDYVMASKHVHQIVHPSGGPMYYYLDGTLVWTEAGATSDSTGTTNGYFANRSDHARGIDADYFTIRRYNRVLSASELVANYSVDKERFNLS